MMINQQNDDLYVAYTTGTTTGSILYKKSDDDGGTWGAATAMSATSDDHRLIMGGTSVGDEGGRWQPIWFNDDLIDLVTNTDNSVEISAVSADTCNPSSPLSANHIFVCSDNCTQSANLNAGGFNITFSNVKGHFNLLANISNIDKVLQHPICEVRRYPPNEFRY